MNYRKPTEADVKAVRGYLAEGFGRRAIAVQLGVSKDSIDQIAVPELYAKRIERQKARRKEFRKGARSEGNVYRVDHHSGKVDADANRLLAQVPVDTRTPMQIQMGEPMPERSALYRKQMGGEA